MHFELDPVRPRDCSAPCVIVGLYEERVFTSACAELDEASGGAIKRLVESGDLSGRLGTTEVLFHLPGVGSPRVLIVGLGEQRKFDPARYVKAVRDAVKAARALPIESAQCYLPELDVPGVDLAWKLEQAALAADYVSYRYTATLKNNEPSKGPNRIGFAALNYQGDALRRAEAVAAGIRLTRELGNLPPNICTPTYLAEQAERMAREHEALSVEVLEREQMQALGMGALLAVAQGSAQPPKLIVLRYQGAGEARPVVLVGKGITFDTGGISIKPSAGMEEMKWDMCGAASVLGVLEVMARLRPKLNVIGLAPAVENMPSGSAYRPSDVVKTMSGQYVEVLNTDAEGRLILCDALTYAQRFQPDTLIDIATLTGACVVALGSHASGLMSKHDDLAQELLAAGERSLDRAWRLPLWDDYQSQLETGFADFANIGGKYAGAITAGCFLARFTEGQRWAHLDIAGSAWEAGRKGTATGRPVALLVEWLLRRAG